jgi:hypothetical protein
MGLLLLSILTVAYLLFDQGHITTPVTQVAKDTLPPVHPDTTVRAQPEYHYKKKTNDSAGKAAVGNIIGDETKQAKANQADSNGTTPDTTKQPNN